MLVSNRDPVPADAPPQPAAVRILTRVLEQAGWTVRVGYSCVLEADESCTHYWGVYGEAHPRRVAAVSRSTDGVKWTWLSCRAILGLPRQAVTVTKLKEFVTLPAAVVTDWLAEVKEVQAEKAKQYHCPKREEHPPHDWTTVTGLAKVCNGKLVKAKSETAL